MEKLSWLGLAVLTTFIVSASICAPQLISQNRFMRDLVTPEIINIAVVMLTVSLPVAYQIMRLIGKDKRDVRNAEKLTDNEKQVICAGFDEVIKRVGRNSTCMIVYFFLLIAVVFLVGMIPHEHLRGQSILMGLALYLLCHMTLFMVELYLALHNWTSIDEFME